MTTSKSTTETAKLRRPTFDEKAVELAKEAIRKLCQEIPELRSALIVFDWRESLNSACPSGVFLSENEDTLLTNTTILQQLSRVLRSQTNQVAADLQQLITNTRETLVRESNLSDAEKASLLQKLSGQCAEATATAEE